MERRQSERVQFFQLTRDDDVLPVWVFQRAYPDATLGLLLDISAEGIQILTDKCSPLDDQTYRLIVHAEETSSDNFITVEVRHLWSKTDGTLYIRNGFAFDDGEDLLQSIERMLAARDAGMHWLRCELATNK